MEADKNLLGRSKMRNPSVKLWRSVRVKFVVIIVSLLLMVISSVATALAIAIVRPYKDVLSNSLLLQTKILLDNLQLRMQNHFSASFSNSASEKEDFELLLLNRVSFPEAQYVVITGKSSLAPQDGIQYVLATDYQDINKIISTNRYIQGVSQFCPDGIDEILQKLTYINSEATEIVKRYLVTIQSLEREIKNLELQRTSYL